MIFAESHVRARIPAFHQASAWKMPGRCLECTWNLRRIPAFHQESTRNVPGGCLVFSRHFPGVFHGDAIGHFHLVFSRHLPGGRVRFRREVGFGQECLVLSWWFPGETLDSRFSPGAPGVFLVGTWLTRVCPGVFQSLCFA